MFASLPVFRTLAVIVLAGLVVSAQAQQPAPPAPAARHSPRGTACCGNNFRSIRCSSPEKTGNSATA